MRKTILLIPAIFIVIASQAQSKSANSSSYKTALGVKVWDGGGITVKHFFAGNNAGELIGYFWNRGFRLTGLYEIHGNISDAPGLRWYIGPGAHLGFYDYYKGNNRIDGTIFGVDGVLGLDYKFRGAPINLSLDWQPSFEFGDYVGFNGNWGGLGIRYTF
ncbi:MAG: hypothetical protein ACRDEB_07110 [Chitinophagaceae bacterium]